MADIQFARDYGLSPGSPFWVVWRGHGHAPEMYATREEAEGVAAKLAACLPGEEVHILAVMATVQTSPTIVGQRFDASRAPAQPIPEFVAEPPAPAPTPLTEEEPI